MCLNYPTLLVHRMQTWPAVYIYVRVDLPYFHLHACMHASIKFIYIYINLYIR